MALQLAIFGLRDRFGNELSDRRKGRSKEFPDFYHQTDLLCYNGGSHASNLLQLLPAQISRQLRCSPEHTEMEVRQIGRPASVKYKWNDVPRSDGHARFAWTQ